MQAPLPGMSLTGTIVPDDADIVLNVVLESVQEGILASGELEAPWEGLCRRCLGRVVGKVQPEFRELFVTEPVEGESYPLRHDQVDLEPLARDAVLLELPLAPLCREECLGLCPACGVDLNQGVCGCVHEMRDERWAALDGLRLEET